MNTLPKPCIDLDCGHGSCDILRRLLAENEEQTKMAETEYQRQELWRKQQEDKDD